MLEFIVLGQIPGTGLVITFPWVVTLITIIGGVSLLRREHKHHDIMQQVSIEEAAL
jgi:hypothetical protein